MKIAVIGAGISGLSAALILDAAHEVHLFESESRLGGHAHTVNLTDNQNNQVPVDTGFLVYNTITYPHFTKFLEYLKVPTVKSDMTLSIQAENGLEWGGANLRTVFAQPKNLFNPAFLKMLVDITHFNKNAKENLERSRQHQWTLEELISAKKYSDDFKTLYLLPMTGAIWSMSYEKALQFPAETFLTFCINHHLLQINNRPVWRTIQGGSVSYVNRVRERLKYIHSASSVVSVKKQGHSLKVCTRDQSFEFDKVVLATHAPTSRRLIQSDFPELADELSPLTVTSNQVVLHGDQSIMPKNKVCWSAWNVQARNHIRDQREICLTYFLNKLQPLVSRQNYFVTLNSSEAFKNVYQRFIYDHPQFSFLALETQKRISNNQGRSNIYFAGAWLRYGFHEDGILSAVNVARQLGVEPPWI